MSKKHKGHRQGSGGSQQSPTANVPTPADSPRVEAIKQLNQEAFAIAKEEDLTSVSEDKRPETAGLDQMWTVAKEARDIFNAATKRFDEETRKAEAARKRAEAERKELEDAQQRLDDQRSELRQDQAALAKGKQDLAEEQRAFETKEAEAAADRTLKEQQLRARELNAEAGFVSERKAMLAEVEKAYAALHQDLTAAEQTAATTRAECEKELREKRLVFTRELQGLREEEERQFAGRCAIREKELRDAEDRLSALNSEIRKERAAIAFEREELKEYREHLDSRMETNVSHIREEFEHKVASLTAQLEQARKDRDQLDAVLRAREDADRSFGRRTPEEVLKELDTLRTEKSRLVKALDERPDAAATTRLQRLESERESWESERVELLRRTSELESRIARTTIAVVELETLRDQKAALESGRAALQQALSDLRAEVDSLISRSDAKTPFPACSAMDADPDMQRAAVMYEDVGDLRGFVEDLQQRIAFDPSHPGRQLFYTLEDLRSFLGGLAMGPLTLLQGISGTGKTSLPIAFARAVGTSPTVVEVQAGWRDPQDLVGHYNVFEKRFYEKEFLKALYRAQTPRWKEAIHIVVLDEMNLSHPEQYFSDLLSALELRPEDRRLVLMTHAVGAAPGLFVGGSQLQIPSNVWFIGTANHDETTKDFADKTYDRANVMEFPHVPQTFPVKRPSPRDPVSFQALQRAFDLAEKSQAKAGQQALEFLGKTIRDPLREYFEIGWGPRLERQIKRYVPVVVAAGGSLGEAIDHVLAMRLLRKIKNRHDNRPEHVEDLQEKIEQAWGALEKGKSARKSVAILQSELRRLGRSS